MTTSYEERLAVACSAYLAAAEQADSERARSETVAMCLRAAVQAADAARDKLLQVVRERDLQAQLDAQRETVQPGPLAAEARDKWLAAHAIVIDTESWEAPQPGSQKWHDLVAVNVCPECGRSWRIPSPHCPKVQFDRHPR